MIPPRRAGSFPAPGLPTAGRHGLRLPRHRSRPLHNFGEGSDPARVKAMVHQAFDLGITHRSPATTAAPGAAETTFGKLLRGSLALPGRADHRQQGGLRDIGTALRRRRQRQVPVCQPAQSLRRSLDYVDIFFYHPQAGSRTLLEETPRRWTLAVRRGKALYVGLSNYLVLLAAQAATGTSGTRHPLPGPPARYSLFQRDIEADTLLPVCRGRDGGGRLLALAGGTAERRYLAGIRRIPAPPAPAPSRPNGSPRTGSPASAPPYRSGAAAGTIPCHSSRCAAGAAAAPW